MKLKGRYLPEDLPAVTCRRYELHEENVFGVNDRDTFVLEVFIDRARVHDIRS